jgi:hypothetical protein
MVCETRLKPRQTVSERAAEIRRAVLKLSEGLASGRIKAKVGPQGGIAFEGFAGDERDGISDACAYRRIMVSGSALAKAAIARAEALAGRTVDRAAVAQGWHMHGDAWHPGHKG